MIIHRWFQIQNLSHLWRESGRVKNAIHQDNTSKSVRWFVKHAHLSEI